MAKLDSCQASMRMDRLHDTLVQRQVFIVPQPQLHIGRNVCRWMNLDLLGANDSPAALCLDTAHSRVLTAVAPSHAIAVRYLVKSVASGLRSDPHRLEQYIVTRITSAHSSEIPRLLWRRLARSCAI